MKLSKKIKTLAAVSILAVGIPAAGIAYASPGQYLNMNKPAATQQMNQNVGPMAGTAQQMKMTPGTHNPANSQMMQSTASASADNSKAPSSMPMVNISPSMAHDPAQMPQMNPNQAAMAVGQQANMGPGANGSGHSNMNSNMHQDNDHYADGSKHSGNEMGSHR